MTYSTSELNNEEEEDTTIYLLMSSLCYQSESDKEATYTTLDEDQMKEAQASATQMHTTHRA